ncbi:MAG TPA: (d)CMP kinase [Clostridiales bacterium]|nr:(d)CMP kinase [Clostridiales bacterium]
MKFYALRGAITVEQNEKDEILSKTRLLLNQLIERNDLENKDIVSIIFTATKDIDAVYPAAAAREMGMTNIPLMCCQEMYVEGSLPLCIRILMHIQLEKERTLQHVYLGKAVTLRPDLAKLTIAIDGPAGAGKSTIAKLLAEKLGILYLDTGAMYRAIGLKILKNGGDPRKPEDVIPLIKDTDVKVQYEHGKQKVYLDGQDVTDEIRTRQVSSAASDVGTIPEVRKKLVELQRQIAERTSLVMDGRDIGTHVMPNATLKIFLTASPEERARRRWKELKEKGTEVEFDTILQEIIQRDLNDSSRSCAPLRKADDAVLIDTTGKSIDQVIKEIENLLKV